MSASIQDVGKRIKSFLSDDVYFYTLLIIVISILSFGLGRMSMQDSSIQQRSPIILTEQSATVTNTTLKTTSIPPKTETIKNFVASKKGTKYHLPTCPGAKQMNEDNKIYFSTKEEAQASGYTPAANCKGL